MSKKEVFLYTYDLSKKKASDKVRFVYVLKGRNEDVGLVRMMKGKFLVPGCFIIPVGMGKEMRDVFVKWGVKYNERRVLLMD